MIRPVNLQTDAERILAIYEPYILDTSVSFEYEVPSLKDFQKRIETISASYPYLVWEEDGEILGYTYASPHGERTAFLWDVDLSIYLKKEAQGKHIGKKLYQALFSILEKQGFITAYASIATPNLGSKEFHQAMGFTHVATFPKTGWKQDSWHDLLWFQKIIPQNGLPEKVFCKPSFDWKKEFYDE